MGLELNQFRAHLVTAMQPLMPPKVNVEAHPGRFDLQEIERYSVSAPCVRIAVLGFTDDGSNEAQGPVSCAAYILTKDGKGVDRDAQNLFLGSLMVAALKAFPAPSPTFSNPVKLAIEALNADAGMPGAIKYQNAYSTYIGKEGLALGTVSWSQSVELAPLQLVQDQLGDFETLLTTYPTPEHAPTVSDESTLPQE